MGYLVSAGVAGIPSESGCSGAYQKDAAIVVSRDVTWCHQKLGMKAHSPARTWLGLGLGLGVRVRS